MLEFDKAISEKINSFGGLYRRYSDDILIVCPDKSFLADLKKFTKTEIEKLGLKIQETKTEERHFLIYENYSSLGTQNYISYASSASEKLNSRVIKKQVGHHRIMKKINKKISKIKEH